MSAQLSMFSQATLRDLPNATSSLESVSGPTLSDKLDGRMTDLFGQEVVPASHSPQREHEKDSTTSVISGLSSSGSSVSAALTQSLANRLRAKTHSLGSTLFRLTWKERTTPSGRSIPALRASVLRISDKDSGGWPTPQNHDDRKRGNTEADHHYSPHDLPNMAELSAWPTPVANDDNKSVEAHLAMKQRMGERDGTGANRTAITSLQVTAKLATWSTPRSNKWGFPDAHGSHEAPMKAGWNSPRGSAEKMGRPREKDWGDLQAQATGAIATGSPASTEKPGQLNPEHSRWLMGIPIGWAHCAATVTRSSLRKLKCS